MNIGDKAPEILGKDEQGRDIRLSDYRGRKLVLYFYPKDNTSGCTAEACSLRDHYAELQGSGYEVVGIFDNVLLEVGNNFAAKQEVILTFNSLPKQNEILYKKILIFSWLVS